jgi:hypothetical protein
VILEFLGDDRAALPGRTPVFGGEIKAKGAVGRESAIAKTGDTEQRIQASSTATAVQVSPPSSVRTIDPPWPTATPSLSFSNATRVNERVTGVATARHD